MLQLALVLGSVALWIGPPLALAAFLGVDAGWTVAYVAVWWLSLSLAARDYCRRRGAWRE
jgi:hypothetical protein